ncbi:MAG: hypothetical protein RLZZ305_902 [Actinomycetota bacterium]|jgi:hypothetical protein
MKTRKVLAVTAGIALAAGFAPSPVGAAGKATAKVVMTGSCADGEMLEGEDDDDCQIMVTITPKSKNTSAVLEVAYDREDPEWEEFDSGKTRGGRLIFEIPSTDEDGVWMDGVVMYRVKVKKSAGILVPKVREYTVEYVSAENVDEEDLAMSDEDKEFNAEMDKAQAENKQHIQQQQPNSDIYNTKVPAAQAGFDKAGVFNRACGAIGFPQADCQRLVAAKTPMEAFQILGGKAPNWCAAIAESFGKKATCDMVMPNVFPPIPGMGPMPAGTSTMPTGG